MSFREIISDKEILCTHIHTNTYCMRSLNPSPIFLAGVTDRTSMLHIFFLVAVKGKIHVVLLEGRKNSNLRGKNFML